MALSVRLLLTLAAAAAYTPLATFRHAALPPFHLCHPRNRRSLARPLAVAPVDKEPLNEVDLMVMVDRWQREDEHRHASAAAALLVEDAPQIRNGAATANGRRASKGSGVYQQRLVEAEGDPADRKPSVEYDPIRAAARFAAQPMAVLRRQMELIGPLLGFLSRVILDKRAGKEAEHRRARADELTELISSLGPAIIKAGQALSSRSDLLPLEYLQSLEQLQDRVPPFPTATAYSIIQAELGASLESMFASIGPEPVAAASLGQVYQAVLATDGTRVAVKVQRPNVEATIALDLYILRSYSLTLRSLLQLLGRNIDFVSVIDDFGRLIYAEVDYEVEAANARRFDELYGALPNVSSPRMYEKLSTRRVLTMGWVDGVRLTDREALLARGLDPAALVDTLVQCSLRQMLEHGFFHADPHAGNLLVTDAGELVYLDFGMMSYLAPTQRYSLIEAVVHMVNRDFGALAELYRNLGFIPPEEDIGPIVTALNAALPDVLNAPISELNFKSVVERLGDVMYKFPFSLPPFYIAILRCLGVLEGLALQVDDKSAIIHDAYPYIAARLLTDRSPQLQRALVTLIFRDGAIQWHLLEGLLDNAAGSRELDLLAAAEQLSGYLLSPEGSPMLERLTDEIVDEIDTLGAESAAYLYQTFGSFAAQLVAEGGPAATAAAAAAAAAGSGSRRYNTSSTSSTSSNSSNSTSNSNSNGNSDALAGMAAVAARLAAEHTALHPPTERMRRAIRVLELLQRSARGGSLELSRIGALATTLLAQERVQRELADVTLQLVERSVRRGIQSFFAMDWSNLSPPPPPPRPPPRPPRRARPPPSAPPPLPQPPRATTATAGPQTGSDVAGHEATAAVTVGHEAVAVEAAASFLKAEEVAAAHHAHDAALSWAYAAVRREASAPAASWAYEQWTSKAINVDRVRSAQASRIGQDERWMYDAEG